MNESIMVRCPWHEEQTPSCRLDLASKDVLCFGCAYHTDQPHLLAALKLADRVDDVERIDAAHTQRLAATIRANW